jgi:hypothetical protein
LASEQLHCFLQIVQPEIVNVQLEQVHLGAESHGWQLRVEKKSSSLCSS